MSEVSRVQDLKERIEEVRRKELLETSKIVLVFLGIPLFIYAATMDFAVIGKNFLWIGLRVGVIPISLTAYYITRFGLVRRMPVIPIIIYYSYIIGCMLFMISRLDYERSIYFGGIDQAVIALALFPLGPVEYLITVIPIIASYFSLLLLFSGRGLQAFSHPHIGLMVIDTVMSFIVFFVSHSIRMKLYRKNIELADEIVDREKLVRQKVSELSLASLDLEKEKLRISYLEELSHLSTRVAQDLELPVGDLGRVDLSLATEDQRNLVRLAIGRINSISELLKKRTSWKDR